jgi:hypothetical protein
MIRHHLNINALFLLLHIRFITIAIDNYINICYTALPLLQATWYSIDVYSDPFQKK